MSVAERLRRLVESLPNGGGVVLDRAALIELATDAGPDAGTDLTVADAAQQLRLSGSAVRRLCESGAVVAYKAGTGRLPDPPVQPAAISGDAVRTVIVASSGEAYEYVRDPTRTTAWTALPSIPTT